MRGFKVAIFFIILLLCFSASAFATLYWYQTNGPYGGYVKCLSISASDPDIMFIGTQGAGIFKSVNGGISWESVNTGLVNSATKVNDLAVHPANPDVVYAATAGDGIARTVNGGSSWVSINNNLLDGEINCVAIDPLDNDRLYAGTSSLGLRRSTSEGDLWEGTALPNNEPINCIEIVSSEVYGKIIYVGTDGDGLWRSTDEVTWQQMVSGEVITCVCAAPSAPESWLYYGRREGVAARIVRTTDEGYSWQVMSGTAINYYYYQGIAVDSASPEVAYAANNGIYSLSGGSWSRADFPYENDFSDIMIHPSDSSRIFACNTGRGFFATQDYGASWSYSNKGLNNAYVRYLEVVSDEAGSMIYAGTSYLGIFRTSDEGDSWDEMNSGVGDPRIYCIRHVPGTDIMYAGTVTSILKSDDLGGTWEVKFALPHLAYEISVDPVSKEVAYAAVGGGGRIYRTLDWGETWASWETGLYDEAARNVIATSYEGETYVHASLTDSKGIWKRKSSDASWQKDEGDLSDVYVFLQNRGTPEVIFASTAGSVMFKTVEAESWDRAIYIGNFMTSLLADPDDPSVYYGIDYRRGVWKYDHYFASRIREERNLPPAEGTTLFQNFRPMVVDQWTPVNSRVFYGEVGGRSVWKAFATAGDIPSAPSNLAGTAESVSSVRWQWQDNSMNEDGFRLFDSGGTTAIATMPSGSTSTAESGFGVNAPAVRRVAAFNVYGQSMSGQSPQVYTLATAPGSPGADSTGITSINITWEAMGNPGYTSYEVEIASSESGPFHVYGVVGTSECLVGGLSPDTGYWFRIRAFNGNGRPTDYSHVASFTTDPPVPSEDIYPPYFMDVRFDDRKYFPGLYGEGDIIYHTPRISCVITDRASNEPPPAYAVTPEGVDTGSLTIYFGDYSFPVSPSGLINVEQPTVEVAFVIPGWLGPASYLCTIEASDNAYPWFNKGAWTGKVRVMGERVEVVGDPLAYPSPYRPLSGDTAVISYTLSTNADVTVYLYDVSGRIVLTRKFSSGSEGGRAGYNYFTWDGRTAFGGVAANGIYVYKIVNKGEVISTGRLVILD